MGDDDWLSPSCWTLEDWTAFPAAPLTLIAVSSAPSRLPLAGGAVGAAPRHGQHLGDRGTGETPVVDFFTGPLSPPAPSPRSQDPSPTSTLGYCRSAPAVPARLPDLPCSSLLPCVGSLDPHRVPVLLQTPRADGVRAPSSVPEVQAESAMRLQALGIWLLGLLLVILLQPVRAPISRAQDESLGVVSSDPLAPGITESL